MSEDQYLRLRTLPLVSVLSALGFSEWRSTKQGAEYFGKCPIHGAKSNKGSFSFHADGKFNCFSCRAKGRGAIDLVMQVKQVNFPDAVDYLKGVDVRQALPVVSPKDEESPPITENKPFSATYEKFFRPHPWLEQRGLKPETLARYGVGFYENEKRRSIYNGSVMLRISRYSDGACVGYLSRNIGAITPEKPKYVFPRGFSKSVEVFGAWQIKNDAKQLPLRVVYVVESPFCVLKFAQLGLPAVSPVGWDISPQQADILSNLARGLLYLPDRNKRHESLATAGRLAQSAWVKTPELPAGVEDPEQLDANAIRSLTGSS